MAGGFTGTPEQFSQAHSKVSDIKGRMDSNLGTLRSNIEATRAGWDGEAALVFQQVMNAFDERTRALNNRLEDIAILLQDSGVKYQVSEEQKTQDMKSHLNMVLDGD